MTYLILSAAYFIGFGWRPFIVSLDLVNSDVSVMNEMETKEGLTVTSISFISSRAFIS